MSALIKWQFSSAGIECGCLQTEGPPLPPLSSQGRPCSTRPWSGRHQVTCREVPGINPLLGQKEKGESLCWLFLSSHLLRCLIKCAAPAAGGTASTLPARPCPPSSEGGSPGMLVEARPGHGISLTAGSTSLLSFASAQGSWASAACFGLSCLGSGFGKNHAFQPAFTETQREVRERLRDVCCRKGNVLPPAAPRVEQDLSRLPRVSTQTLRNHGKN